MHVNCPHCQASVYVPDFDGSEAVYISTNCHKCDGAFVYNPDDITNDQPNEDPRRSRIMVIAAASVGLIIGGLFLLGLKASHDSNRAINNVIPTGSITATSKLNPLGLSIEPLPPGIGWDAKGIVTPMPGYDWDKDESSTAPRTSTGLHVKWTPGKRHSPDVHLVAGESRGSWLPEVGYKWINPGSSDLAVRWMPGTRIPSFPRISAAEREGYWVPDAGYRWVIDDTRKNRLQWSPGTRDPDCQQAIAARTEGLWVPEAGYSLTVQDGHRIATWTPGTAHPEFNAVEAGIEPGMWKPSLFWRWVSDDPSDMRVVWDDAAYKENERQYYAKGRGRLRAQQSTRRTTDQNRDAARIVLAGAIILGMAAALSDSSGGDTRIGEKCLYCSGRGFSYQNPSGIAGRHVGVTCSGCGGSGTR